jgi:hypothetical protein
MSGFYCDNISSTIGGINGALYLMAIVGIVNISCNIYRTYVLRQSNKKHDEMVDRCVKMIDQLIGSVFAGKTTQAESFSFATFPSAPSSPPSAQSAPVPNDCDTINPNENAKVSEGDRNLANMFDADAASDKQTGVYEVPDSSGSHTVGTYVTPSAVSKRRVERQVDPTTLSRFSAKLRGLTLSMAKRTAESEGYHVHILYVANGLLHALPKFDPKAIGVRIEECDFDHRTGQCRTPDTTKIVQVIDIGGVDSKRIGMRNHDDDPTPTGQAILPTFDTAGATEVVRGHIQNI